MRVREYFQGRKKINMEIRSGVVEYLPPESYPVGPALPGGSIGSAQANNNELKITIRNHNHKWLTALGSSTCVYEA